MSSQAWRTSRHSVLLAGETRVVDAITKLSKELSADIQIKDFIRFNLGEGIEKDNKQNGYFCY